MTKTAALELPPDIETAARSGDRVLITRDGVTLAAIVPMEDLRRLERLEQAEAPEQPPHDTAALDQFIDLVGQVHSGQGDVSADKYKHLQAAYTPKS